MQSTSAAAPTLAPAGLRELVAGVTAVLAVSRFLDGSPAAAVALLLFGAVLVGALQLFGETAAVEVEAQPWMPAVPRSRLRRALARWPSTRRAGVRRVTRGVPIETLVEPAVLAFGAVGAIQLAPIGLAEVPLVAGFAWLLLRDLELEARLVRAVTATSSVERTAVLGMTMVAGLAAFAGIGALVPGGLPDPSGTAPTTPSLVLGLAAADGLVAFALAYRVAALRTSNVRDIGWAASAGAAVVAIAEAFLRTLEIPGLLGPALLVLVFFLWEAMHNATPARRRDPRRVWETVLLFALGLVVVAWSVGLRG